MIDNLVKITGKYSVMARSMVIHEKEDNLGKGDNEESLINGNAVKELCAELLDINYYVLYENKRYKNL